VNSFNLDFFDLETIIHIGTILVIGLVATGILGMIARRVEKSLSHSADSEERQQRLNTLLQAGRSLGSLIILLVIILMILNELQINILPILASAGVVGLALSLGAQTFIKDFFGGIVVLVENQFSVGDTIQVGAVTGTVERITLRATYLRDLEGNRIAVPNGDIRTVSNLSTEWARAVVTLNVPITADMDQVMEALSAAAQEAGQDPTISKNLLSPPETQGWVDLTDTAVRVRLMAKTRPGRQWEVAQVLRKYALHKLYPNTTT
jgi:small conductance mechanosensitive channel